MENYIAIDNVCAWPNLTPMPDGSITAVIFSQPTHGRWQGDVECWGSEDEGCTWSLRGVPAPHEAGTVRLNVAVGLAGDGALVVIAAGFDKRPPAGQVVDPQDVIPLPLWVCRSQDGGRTWEREGSVQLPCPDSEVEAMPFGDIIALADGSLGASLYSWPPFHSHASAHFYTSRDGGRVWESCSVIQPGDTNETALLSLDGNRLLAAARTSKARNVEMFVSDDAGATWSGRGAVTMGNQHPAHLLSLADGRVLIVYGIRNQGLRGVGACLSEDRGGSWGSPILLARLEGAGDVGYPSSVQTADGTIVTAYYCDRIEAHQRYHMGVVRWRAED